MTINNSKHVVASRAIAINPEFVLPLGLIDVVTGISTISHLTTKSSSVHVQFFRYSPTSQSLSQSQAHILLFQA